MNDQINYSIEMLNSETSSRQPIVNLLINYSSRLDLRSKVLEIGCGNGRNLQVFKDLGIYVYGLDGLNEAAAYCRNIGIPCELQNLDDNPKLPQGQWDLILILDVLEHLQNPKQLLLNAKASLNKNGRILINVPNHFTAQGRLRILFGGGIDSELFFPNHKAWDYPHIRFFRHKDIIELVNEVEMKIETDFSRNQLRIPKFIKNVHTLNRIYSALPTDLICGGFFLELSK